MWAMDKKRKNGHPKEKGKIPERRKYKRAPFRGSVEIQTVTPSKTGNVYEIQSPRIPLSACNIGEGGLELSLPSDLKPGTLLKLTFRTGPEGQELSEAFARVVWNRDGRHGVQFLMLEDETHRRIRGIVRDQED
jgi:hypothetical protein